MSEQKHEITMRSSPLHRMAFCSCGWRGQVTRSPNALGQTSKLRGLINKHLRDEKSSIAKAKGGAA